MHAQSSGCTATAPSPVCTGVGERLDTARAEFRRPAGSSPPGRVAVGGRGLRFQFVNALQWRRPLLARRLPVLDDLQALLDGYPAAVYDAVHCPLPRAERDVLRAAYEPAAERAARLLPENTGQRLRAELGTILSGDTVDFSYLGTAQQSALLRRCGDPGVAHELRRANATLLDTVQALPHRRFPTATSPSRRRSARRRSPGAPPPCSRRCWLQAPEPAGLRPRTAPPTPTSTPAAVQRAFAKPAALRLLMES